MILIAILAIIIVVTIKVVLISAIMVMIIVIFSDDNVYICTHMYTTMYVADAVADRLGVFFQVPALPLSLGRELLEKKKTGDHDQQKQVYI